MDVCVFNDWLAFKTRKSSQYGKFYICPAFYLADENNFVGDLTQGLIIKNKQLYQITYAPICSNCDTYQCKRCVWLNKKTTLEINTPSHEQCVTAHLERNASRELLIVKNYEGRRCSL
ncbi:hypothetical protein AGMMS50239_18130 [Bacteroidia bacterium]|nr:hypothetical protein FACS1894207_2520 [Bacteroidia bacterium]GHT63036.1 hypothetical protein AGMMS50239_18130 [Bacteroidia bacterium]